MINSNWKGFQKYRELKRKIKAHIRYNSDFYGIIMIGLVLTFIAFLG